MDWGDGVEGFSPWGHVALLPRPHRGKPQPPRSICTTPAAPGPPHGGAAVIAGCLGRGSRRRGGVPGSSGGPSRRRSGRGAAHRAGSRALPGDRSPAAAIEGHRGHPAPLRPARGDHPGDGVRGPPRGHGPRAGARRDRPRPGHPPGQRQPPRVRADGHRPQLPGEGQRQHRQLGGVLVDRRGGGEAHLGHPLGAPTR